MPAVRASAAQRPTARRWTARREAAARQTARCCRYGRSSGLRPEHLRLLAKVARMYHERGLRQPQIALT
jgi:hypothetical protein